MNAKQRRFVDEYLIDLNATQAAIRSGYSPKTAYSSGQRLLRDVEISAQVKASMDARSARTLVTQDRILDELAVVGFSSVADYAVDDDGNVTLTDAARPDALRALSSIKRKRRTTYKDGGETVEVDVEIRLWNKPEALRLGGQHLGMYTEKHEVSTPQGAGVLAVPVPVDAEQWAGLAAQQQAALLKRRDSEQPK